MAAAYDPASTHTSRLALILGRIPERSDIAVGA